MGPMARSSSRCIEILPKDAAITSEDRPIESQSPP